MHVQTSIALQKQFPEVYKDFFAKHDVVVSIPLTIRFGIPGIESKSNIPYLLMKLPRRCYMGLKKSKKSSYGTLVTYDDTTFHEEKIVEGKDVFISEHIHDMGWEVSFLCESDAGHSLGFFSALASLIALLPSLEKNDMHKYLERARIIESGKKGSEATGDRSFISLSEHAYGLYLYNPDSGIHHTFTDFADAQFGYDIAVIYSGRESNLDTAKLMQSSKKKIVDGYENDVLHLHTLLQYQGNNAGDLLDDVQEYMRDMQTLFTTYLYRHLEDPLNELYKKKLHSLAEVLTENLSLLGYSNTLFDLFEEGNMSIVLPLFTGLTGGSFLCLIPYEWRDEFLKRLQFYKQQFPSLTKQYFSREDGTESEGLRFEQDVRHGMYSSRVSVDDVLYINNQGVKELGTAASLHEKRKKGILVDMQEGKIYCDGEKLTSKYLESQTTTAELLGLCVKYFGQEVKNTDLGVSTMTRQYNQFLSKIMIPLQKVVKEKYDLDLAMETHGSLREFTITLNEKRIPLGIITTALG